MQNALVIVLCNLRPKKLAGAPSHGMVLCAETSANKESVELLSPPAGSEPGDLITFEGQPRDPPALLHKDDKKNVWFKLAPDMKTNASKVANWQENAMTTPKGTVMAASIASGIIA
eukprot:Macronucleus_8638.p1 GENE.Macronucleus_8638~~Macronucleus_8638.p1  ORF type:complete len:116 (+),score=32.42 Macronucleus_8638:1-348(+)